jgi:hypothetical protein
MMNFAAGSRSPTMWLGCNGDDRSWVPMHSSSEGGGQRHRPPGEGHLLCPMSPTGWRTRRSTRSVRHSITPGGRPQSRSCQCGEQGGKERPLRLHDRCHVQVRAY